MQAFSSEPPVSWMTSLQRRITSRPDTSSAARAKSCLAWPRTYVKFRRPLQQLGRSWPQIKTLLTLSLATLLGVGCAGTPQRLSARPVSAATSPSVTQINSALVSAALQASVPNADYRIGAEDLLEITFFNVPETGSKVTPRKIELRVNQEGKITVPLIGDIPVTGLTTSALEQSLRKQFDEYLYDPQVGVYVKEYRSQRISVMGEVRNPGVFQLTGPKTLVDLLAMAGGLNEHAGSVIHVYRQEHEGRHTYVVDLLALANNPGVVNMPVQPGDVIDVPHVGTFFVDGSIGRPGSYPLTRSHTLTQALAVAGGVTERLADYNSIVVFRRQNSTEPERIPVNLREVLAGRATDPLIEAGDVIIVPMSTVKYIVERFIGTIGLPGVPVP
jgi:polysaccharide biosynthesis/export protein